MRKSSLAVATLASGCLLTEHGQTPPATDPPPPPSCTESVSLVANPPSSVSLPITGTQFICLTLDQNSVRAAFGATTPLIFGPSSDVELTLFDGAGTVIATGHDTTVSGSTRATVGEALNARGVFSRVLEVQLTNQPLELQLDFFDPLD